MENKHIKEEVIRISGSNPKKCMKCGKCTATCPAFDEMDFHPHQFVDMVVNGRVEELLNSRGIYNCLSCFACMERCPRSVEPARLIEAVRVAVIRQKDNNHLKPDAIPAMLDSELPQQAITSALRKYRK
jgi:heterodisulfide reductase subunit C